jgi:hypothetical protein
MQWLLTGHVRRYHKHYGGSGHVWQGRFKSFSVQRDVLQNGRFQTFQWFNRFASLKTFKSQRLGEGEDVSGILETSK